MRNRLLGGSLLCLFMLPPMVWGQAAGQAPFKVVSLDFGFGGFTSSSSSASAPTQDCSTAPAGNSSIPCAEKFSGTPSIDLALGVRPFRYIQGGLGFSYLGNVGGFANVPELFQCVSNCTGTVSRNIATHSLLFTSDARGVLPLFHERLVISGGGGIGWLQISQSPQAVGNEQLQGCGTCQSRQGHGPTEVGEIVYMIRPLVGIGFHFRALQVHSLGFTPYTGIPGGATYRDHFNEIGGNVTLRLGSHH